MKAAHRGPMQKQKRRWRVRNKLRAVSDRPRLSIFRSNKYIYAQLIDDVKGHSVAAASSAEKAICGEGESKSNREAATKVGRAIAARAIALGLKNVVFDRGHYRYHGRVAALADGAREAGLEF